MRPEELAKECIRAITRQPGAPFIVIIGKLPQKGWPRGKCVGSDSRGRFYAYDAYKVLARIMHPALGLVSYETVSHGKFADDCDYTGEIRIIGDATIYKLNSEQHRRMMIALHGYLFRSTNYAGTIPKTETP